MAGKGKYYESQFEEATIELLRESHWQYTFGDDIHRKYTDPLIEEDLRTFIAAQYKDKKLTASEMDGIIANLRNTGGQNDYYALQNTFLLYRDGYDFTYSDGRDNPFRLQYIDFEHPDHNIFRCVNQFVMEQGRENRRPDILHHRTQKSDKAERDHPRCPHTDLYPLYAGYTGLAEILCVGGYQRRGEERIGNDLHPIRIFLRMEENRQ